MTRRDLILALALAAPGAARAQDKPLPVVAYLSIGSPAGRERYVEAFRDGLRERGYRDHQNVIISFHWAGEDYSRIPQLATELSARYVDLIVAPQIPTALAAMSATRTLPIVFLMGDDPVKHGLAASFGHPGGNATGISMLSAGLVVKRFELLRDLVPKEGLIAVLMNPNNQSVATQLDELNEASDTTHQPIKVFIARNRGEIEAQFASINKARAKALIVGADPFLNNDRAQIVALAAQHAIPGIYEFRESVDIGGLASYGPSLIGVHRQLGHYAGRILKGEKPADLPVQQPTKFELVINLRTAKALGLTVPNSILARADEILE